MRVDLLLVQRGLAPTRSAAQRLIESGGVVWRRGTEWVAPRKTGEDLADAVELRIVDDAELRWASRAGLKLAGALQRVTFDVADQRVLDVGQSSGGFTDVLLHAGARQVVGVEVGHGQLVARLRGDPRVSLFEGLDVRDAPAHEPPLGVFARIVGDLSFISLVLVLPSLARLLAPGGLMLLLVKPQFELQPGAIGKGGLVRPEADLAGVDTRLRAAAGDLGLNLVDSFESCIRGGDGNREWFVLLQAAIRCLPVSS